MAQPESRRVASHVATAIQRAKAGAPVRALAPHVQAAVQAAQAAVPRPVVRSTIQPAQSLPATRTTARARTSFGPLAVPHRPLAVQRAESSSAPTRSTAPAPSTAPPPPPSLSASSDPSDPTAEEQAAFEQAYKRGGGRVALLARGPQDWINPGISQHTWNVYRDRYQEDVGPSDYGVAITTRYRTATSGDERYENYIDFATGTIVASHNVRSKSENTAGAQYRLSGSEMIFRQITRLEDRTGVPFILRKLTRKAVINDTAQTLIRYLRKVCNLKQRRDFRAPIILTWGQGPSHDRYIQALLGTDNATAAVFLVHDHGTYLAVSGIDRVVVTSKGSIEFYFRWGRIGR